MGIFDGLLDLAKNVTDIVLAPVEVAVDIARGVTKPIADAANEVVEDIKEETEQD